MINLINSCLFIVPRFCFIKRCIWPVCGEGMGRIRIAEGQSKGSLLVGEIAANEYLFRFDLNFYELKYLL